MTKTNKYIKSINIALVVILILSIIAPLQSVFAYTDGSEWKGYAIYRDGISGGNLNVNDHAGLMDEKNKNVYKPVLHAPGYGSNVEWGTWDEFINGKNYLGIFRPKNITITETKANSFVAKARELRGISYNVLDQIVYSAGSNDYVRPEHISHLRCDGVVEYTYEWYNHRVGGGNNSWDISVNELDNYWAHSGFEITPRKQNQELLYKVSSTWPN